MWLGVLLFLGPLDNKDRHHLVHVPSDKVIMPTPQWLPFPVPARFSFTVPAHILRKPNTFQLLHITSTTVIGPRTSPKQQQELRAVVPTSTLCELHALPAKDTMAVDTIARYA